MKDIAVKDVGGGCVPGCMVKGGVVRHPLDG
jgi:hypothetical protein